MGVCLTVTMFHDLQVLANNSKSFRSPENDQECHEKQF